MHSTLRTMIVAAAFISPAMADDGQPQDEGSTTTVAFILEDPSHAAPLPMQTGEAIIFADGEPIVQKLPSPAEHAAPEIPSLQDEKPVSQHDMDGVITHKWQAFENLSTDLFFKAHQ